MGRVNRISATVEGFQSVVGKFKGMRKDVEWTVYPHVEKDEYWIIQSSKRIAKVFKKTGKAVLSKAGNSHFAGLSDMMGATAVNVPDNIMKQLNAMPYTGKTVRIL